jgi:OOP family OmpA-OmpF porin
MIKFTTTIAVLLITSVLTAQQDSLKGKPFNRWSVEINAGQNKALKPFSAGYYSADPDKFFTFSGVNHFDAGVRYMLSETFGFKLDGAYDQIENQDGSSSLPFSTKSYRIGLQGVVNLGHIMNFESFTKRFGLLGHAGMQVSRFVASSDRHEKNGGVVLGITPQFRLARWCALTGDFTYIGNVRQHLTWDGQFSPAENNLAGSMVHTSLGLTFYLGKKATHADWYSNAKSKAYMEEVTQLSRENKKRLDDFEKMMDDTDRDGVPDYLDAQNNTPNGVKVDAKGRFLDSNGNGTPDELEPRSGRDGKSAAAATNGSNGSSTQSDALRELIAGGYLNVFYEVNKDVPNAASSNNIYHIIRYLKKFPNTRVTLIGYADKQGNEKTNRELSRRRAEKLSGLMKASGIPAGRITISGEGVDSSFPGVGAGLQLARRVSITIE